MAISLSVDIIPVAMWPQGDARDPLGVWGARLGVTGDASGGSIKVVFAVPEDLRGAHVYTIYDLTYAQLTGATNVSPVKSRILTNWPDIDPIAGIQGFGNAYVHNIGTNANFTAPLTGVLDNPMIYPLQRFLLCMTREGSGLDIAELEWGGNIDAATFTFEGYGYYWDRGVMNAPGGPRHPGSS